MATRGPNLVVSPMSLLTDVADGYLLLFDEHG